MWQMLQGGVSRSEWVCGLQKYEVLVESPRSVLSFPNISYVFVKK